MARRYHLGGLYIDTCGPYVIGSSCVESLFSKEDTRD